MSDRPRMSRSKFHVVRWFESIEQRQDPTGIAVDFVFYHVARARLKLPWLFLYDPWGGSTVCSGNNPSYLGDDPQEDGWAEWDAVAPCVAVTHSLNAKKQVVLEAHLVVTQEHLDRVQQRMKCPSPGLMTSLTSLITLPKAEQRRRAAQPPDPGPNRQSPEGSDPHGDS